MHDDERRVFRAAIHRRASNLMRITAPEVGEIKVVTAFIARSLLTALVGYCGDELAAEVFGWLRNALREGVGLCTFCGEQKRHPNDPMCRTCIEELEASERELDEAEAEMAVAATDDALSEAVNANDIRWKPKDEPPTE
jgi:hypothetical protein